MAKSQKPRELVLQHPFEFAGTEHTAFTVKRLKAKSLRALDDLDESHAGTIALAAMACGVDEAIIDEMDLADFLALQEIIEDFFPSALLDKVRDAGSGSAPTS